MRDGLIHRIWSSNKLHQPDALIPVLQAHEVSCWGSKSALMAAVGVSCTFSSSTTSSEDKSLKPPDSHPFISF
ncbi:D-cysteine desulfhydrase 2, mitochondrial-like isoform X3 [Physcomitrium patens]|uniref:D-cysteine desulfhydrase 2, mitochondrial-like isoform X3 n=1 Tax=Physcomitrium patens TaxID=3218 RepID=UPI003CCE1627